MVTTVHSLVTYLQHASPLIGLPLLLAGVLLAVGGWRIRKSAVPASFGLIGVLIGLQLGKTQDQDWLCGAVGFILLAVIGRLLADRAVVVLGGLIGAGMVNYLAARLGLDGAALWVTTAIGMVVFAAFSFIDLRQVVILITSFEGAVLLVSAGVAFVAGVPWIANQFRGTSWGWALLGPFVLLVPTVIGTMMQMADAKQHDRGMVES